VILASSFITSSVALLASMPFFVMEPAERRRVEEFHQRLATPIGDLEEDRPAAAGASVLSPFRIVGVTIGLAGVLMLAVQPWVKALPDSDPRTGTFALTLNLGIGIGLMAIGALMAWLTRKPRGSFVPPPLQAEVIADQPVEK